MILWRLTCDHDVLLAGSCIDEEAYKKLYYTDRPMYEPLTEDDQKIMIEVKNKRYIQKHNLVTVYFWSEVGVNIFNEKMQEWITHY